MLQDASWTGSVCRELECQVSIDVPQPRVTGVCISIRQLISCLCVNSFPLRAFCVQNEYKYKFLVRHLCKSLFLSSLSLKVLARSSKVFLASYADALWTHHAIFVGAEDFVTSPKSVCVWGWAFLDPRQKMSILKTFLVTNFLLVQTYMYLFSYFSF